MFTHAQIWDGIDRLAVSFGYSTSGLAKKAGLDPTSFNKSKRFSSEGKPRWPSTESLSKVLGVTGTTMSDFIALVQANENDIENAISPVSDEDMARRTAEILIETESVLFDAKNLFTVKSGRQQPVYLDCRRMISFVRERDELMDFAARKILRDIGRNNIDVLAGGETAGIPYAAFIADRIQKPMVYVRKEPKGHGRMAQIEGALPKDTPKPNTVLIEDLQTDGGSKEIFVNALRTADCQVKHAFVLFHYGILAKSEENMKRLGLELHCLATWWDVIKVAEEKKYFDAHTLKTVKAFLNDPLNWSP